MQLPSSDALDERLLLNERADGEHIDAQCLCVFLLKLRWLVRMQRVGALKVQRVNPTRNFVCSCLRAESAQFFSPLLVQHITSLQFDSYTQQRIDIPISITRVLNSSSSKSTSSLSFPSWRATRVRLACRALLNVLDHRHRNDLLDLLLIQFGQLV